MAVIKKESKCYHCGATLEVGTWAGWYHRTGQDNGHMQKIRSLGYAPVCGNKKECGHRQGQAYLAKVNAEKQKQAQETIDLMRTVKPEIVNILITEFAKQGIVVL